MKKDRSEDNYHTFLRRVIDKQWVWTLKDEHGFVRSKDDENMISLWANRGTAEEARKAGAYDKCRALPLSLFDLLFEVLPEFKKEELALRANWAGDEQGEDCDPNQLRDDLLDQMPRDMRSKYLQMLTLELNRAKRR